MWKYEDEKKYFLGYTEYLLLAHALISMHSESGSVSEHYQYVETKKKIISVHMQHFI